VVFSIRAVTSSADEIADRSETITFAPSPSIVPPPFKRTPLDHKRALSSASVADASGKSAKKVRQETTLDIETLTRENADLMVRVVKTYARIF
jgi:hypothetical protein